MPHVYRCKGLLHNGRSLLQRRGVFLENEDPVNALASFSYGHAWLDAGAKLGVFAVDDETLFTI
ncbi:MAG: DUF357 domain-containing protein [Methanosarcina barkeri]|nr:DUF357 domain-containing protein [Methanosarcina sp. ERenArc_MAG2]